jgi:hypothetical protein
MVPTSRIVGLYLHFPIRGNPWARCLLDRPTVEYKRLSGQKTESYCVEAASNTSTVTLRVVGGDEMGSLKSETAKYGRESQGTRTRERLRWQGPAAYTKNRPVREGATQKQDRNCLTVMNIWWWAPDGARHQDWLTDWLTVSRNGTLTWLSQQNWEQKKPAELRIKTRQQE